MDMETLYFKSELTWINLFVGGELYPVQLRTLLNSETCGSYFKDKVHKESEGIRVSAVQWESSPNHIKYRIDIDRDGTLFRQVLQYIRNGAKTSVPEDQFTLQAQPSQDLLKKINQALDQAEKNIATRKEPYDLLNRPNSQRPNQQSVQQGQTGNLLNEATKILVQKYGFDILDQLQGINVQQILSQRQNQNRRG
ncbi:hypothetical protein WR25_14514 [Diploscapter pachys]|uniref:Potassium channel tetramerisation-type BTB domain-containing protein n=1 Tax=Diploscapter pachys TaxID=2018661 RepID=A0A2A2JU18_9BILA|nr:hypothetical protein WR25_14514 [Diploscapter pachys]